MKHKVAELTGEYLDAAVALAEGARVTRDPRAIYADDVDISFGTDRRLGDAIVKRERIKVLVQSGRWHAETENGFRADGDTRLIAAMRASVASKCGEEIELP